MSVVVALGVCVAGAAAAVVGHIWLERRVAREIAREREKAREDLD